MKKELLSPVGNYESLKQAIHNGADAVYLGGKKFGARAFADNFNEEELKQAIKYCHLYGVKIYITVNTMIYENEMEECLDYIRFLHQNNVDAIIMQDLGLIRKTKEMFPNLEIHASTQMHNHNQEQMKLLEELGVKRVVLARELSIEEINALKTNMEIEAFIHGALCISYSGQCLFSSLLLNRSGNRGSCAGICRLPFGLVEEENEIKTDGQYLLSPKELNTINNFQEIMESNIDSLKIEGRMKSPAYVGFITKLYRTLIDNYYQKKPLEVPEQEIEKLKLLFNRGFTKGHLFHDKNEDLMNAQAPNHQGIEIGSVIETTKEKIKIKLTHKIAQEDGIRFPKEDKGCILNFIYNEKGLLIHEAKAGEIIFIKNKINLKTKDKVLKTIDTKLMKDLESISYKKIPITCKMVAKEGKELHISFNDGENQVYEYGSKVELAKINKTTKDVIKEKISALGNSPFLLQNLEIEMDENIFIPMSELKNMRRNLEQMLIEKRENKIPHPFYEKNGEKNIEIEPKKIEKIKLHVLVRNEEQLKYCLKKNVDSIYVTDEILYQKYKEYKNVYLRLSRVKNAFKELMGERLLVGETGALFKYGKENNVVTDYYLNIANVSSFQFLENKNASRITLSIEMDLGQMQDLCNKIEKKNKIELFLYGRPEAMVMKYCPLNRFVNKEKICKICRNGKKYFLKDRKGKLYPILTEAKENHLTHLLYYKNMDRIDQLDLFKKMGIQNYRIELLEETPEEIESILRKIA